MAHAQAQEQEQITTWSTYKWVALVLLVVTIVEVWVYYIPSFVASRLFAPTLLVMSAFKFAVVVMFYMHLKFDKRIFRAFLVLPLLVAMVTLLSLLFLFGHLRMTTT